MPLPSLSMCVCVSVSLSNTCSIPVRLSVEESTGGVNVDNLSINNCAVALLGILLGGIAEEPTADGLLDSGCVLSARHHVQLVPKVEKQE